MESSENPVGGMTTVKDSGQKRLEEMGYKQELKRDLTILTNFFFVATLLGVLTGTTPLFSIGLTYGGPVSYIYGWPLVGIMNIIVALSMAEITSAFPTAGGLYYWSYCLAGPKWGPFASWVTGWFNLIGQVMGFCSTIFSLALLLQTIILLSTGGGNGGGYYASKYVVLGMHGGLIVIAGLINCFAVGWLGKVFTFGMAWSLLGVLIQVFLVPLTAVHRANATFVFTSFNTDNGLGIHSYPYIFAVGLLLSQFTIAGYDSSAHMSEETKESDRGSAIGMVAGVAFSVVLGWIYLVAITFTVVSPARLLDPANDARGYALAQLLYDVFHDRYGSGTGGILVLGISAVCLFLGSVGILSVNSRLLYAFSRDGAVPFWRVWRVLDRNKVPVPAVWLSAFIAFVAALTYLKSAVAFQATVSIALIAVFISYSIPIFFRITIGHKDFVPGPFHLGRFSRLVGTISISWVIIISVLFCLPVAYPITSETFNYAPALVGGAMILVLGSWFTYVKSWFKGPHSNKNRSGLDIGQSRW